MAMHQGNWKCSKCEGTITELPFEPRSESGLTCRDCWSKDNGKNSAPAAEPVAATSEEMPADFPMDENMTAGEMPTDDGFADATPVAPGEKKRFEGDWKCAGCGGSITSLPFSPRDTSNLKCIECFKASKQ